MKTNKNYIHLLLILLLYILSTAGIQAQEGLQINSIFKKYGKQKGATMVVMSGKSLHMYQLDKYKGITLTYDKKIIADIQRCLEADKKNASQVKEVVSDGIITSGYYRLDGNKKDIKRYILFKMGNDGTATLIYLEGGADSENLINKLFIKNK